MKMISGIQQIGIGVRDVHEAFRWYRRHLGMDTPIFEDKGEAALMLPYTGGQPRERHAILAANLQGGSAFEVWQHTGRSPLPPAEPPRVGDLGVVAARLKCRDIHHTHRALGALAVPTRTPPLPGPDGVPHFFLDDPYGNLFEVVQSEDWYYGRPASGGRAGTGAGTGGVCGCQIGVSDIDQARRLYEGILGYDLVRYDETGTFEDFAALPGGTERVRRVLLTHREPRRGAFSRWFGSSCLELVQVLSRRPVRLFEGRYWGDLGFIHLCFDVNGMDALRDECAAAGFPFTVDSADSFDMGQAAGRFAYTEDPDGTLIEFVETHRIPVVRKLGFYIDLRRRNPARPLPALLFRAFSLMRVRD